MALSPKTARTLNKKKNKMSCAAVGQKRLSEPIQNVCMHKRTAGRSSEWRVQFSAAAWTCWESPMMSLSLAGCSTPEPRRLRKPDHRRWRDESVERQERRWLLIAVIAVCQDLKQTAGDWGDCASLSQLVLRLMADILTRDGGIMHKKSADYVQHL